MKRIEMLLRDPLYHDYMERNINEERNLKYCRHDLHHHTDVARIAYILVLENNDLGYFVMEANLSGRLAAKELIYAAGLLHDIGKWKEYQMGVDHASMDQIGARHLTRIHFNENEIKSSVGYYEHRNISRDMSFLGERIHRADNLSRVCSQCVPYRCPEIENKIQCYQF